MIDICKMRGYSPKVTERFHYKDFYDRYLSVGNPCILRDWYTHVYFDRGDEDGCDRHPNMLKRIYQMETRRNYALGFRPEDWLTRR